MNTMDPKVLVVMGSDSDFEIMKGCLRTLKKFGVNFDCIVCSAHRTPDKAAQIAKTAKENGYDCIIAAAGKAAHLPGVLAAFTCLPVIGVPIKSDAFDGLDAMLAMVQMPPGIPVATIAVNGADNAAILAVEIMSGRYAFLYDKLLAYKAELSDKVEAKNKALQEKIAEI